MAEFDIVVPEASAPTGDPARAALPAPRPERIGFARQLMALVPPWLRRTNARAFWRAIGRVLDSHLDRVVAAASARFPNADRPDALAAIGKERGFRRGPGQSRESFAARLRQWWDIHRHRGTAPAMLRELQAQLGAVAPVRMDLIDGNGTRHRIDPDGAITRDQKSWGADGSGRWARGWLMVRLASPSLLVPQRDATGATIEDAAGNVQLTPRSIYALTPTDEAMFVNVVREWCPAHIERVTVTLLAPGIELWGYALEESSTHFVGTWAENDPSAGQVWPTQLPVQIEVVI